VGDTATLDIELTEGGIFDSGTPIPIQTQGQGTITLVFHDCENATLTYNIPSIGRMGSIKLVRLAPDNVLACMEMIESQ
jgi:hypothetical protein